MTKATIAKGALITLAGVALIAGYRALERQDDPAPATPVEVGEAPGNLYGRVTTYDGATYEGGMRWGNGEEAFWGHYFNGVKDENPWAEYVPPERLTEEGARFEVFGIGFGNQRRQINLSRPFMVRFGDIAHIVSRGEGVQGVLESGVQFDPDVRVTLKSGAVFDLDRLSASDFDDGVRVWDGRRGVVDLGPREIRTVEFLPTPRPRDIPNRLHGTVHTGHGDFTGFLQWDREEALGSDRLVGRTADGERRLRFDAVRSIARHADGSLVTLFDGRELVLSGTQKVGTGNRGVYVDDPRYGRVLVSWDALERVDFSPGGRGLAYEDFLPGHPLTGSVITRDGRRLSGRLVYDLDESESTETLDAPSHGVDYTIPFGRVASIVLPAGDERTASRGGATVTVTLQGGEELQLERTGDLGEGNAGVLVFADGEEQPEYVPWPDVERIDLNRPPAVPSTSGSS